VQHHHAVFDPRLATEYRFDLAGLDAKAAQFDLVVDTAQVLEVAVGQPAGQIAGLVDALKIAKEFDLDKLPGGQVGAIQVASRQTGAGNTEFTGNADGGGLVVGV